jgi:hypothetical protein
MALAVCGVGLLSTCVQQALAADEVLAQVTEIFAAVDGPSKNESPAVPAYTRLQKLKPGEPASDAARYAYLLGLVELRRHREAVAYAGELIQHNPHDVRGRLLRARLLLREKKFAEALVDLEAAGRSLAPQSSKETLDAETEAACRALGLMFGYLEGPAKPLVKATLGAGVKDRLMANFSAAARQAFQEQYDAVLEEQKELSEKGEAAFRKKQADIQQEIDEVADRRAKLAAQATESEQQKQAAIDQLTKKWEAAKADYDKRAAAFVNLQNEQEQLIARRELLARQADAALPRDPERDSDGNIIPADRDRYNREKLQYDLLVRQVNFADRQIVQNDTSLQQMWNQGANAEAGLVRLQAEGDRLGVEFSLKERAFAREQARLNRQDPRKKKLPTAPSKRSEQTFAQYDDFNYLQEKQRLLESLRAAEKM